MERSWNILLLGGSSATGKSTLAKQLAQHFKLPLTELDDIRIALQQVMNKETHPDLFTFIDNPHHLIQFNVKTLTEKLLAVGHELSPALNALIEKHIACNEPVIYEGDSILPDLLVEKNNPEVKVIFLYDNLHAIQKMTLERGRTENEIVNIDKQTEFSFEYGKIIKQQAEKKGYTVVQTTPVETLFNRVLQLL